MPVAHAPVTVGVIDTGIDDMHPDLAGRVDQTRSVSCAANGIASQAYGSWRDDYFHGTHVAGIIAANHNSIGIDGIAPDATLVSIKAANSEQLIYPEYVTCARSCGRPATASTSSTTPTRWTRGWVLEPDRPPEQAAGPRGRVALHRLRAGQGTGRAPSPGGNEARRQRQPDDRFGLADGHGHAHQGPALRLHPRPRTGRGSARRSALKRVNEETKPEWTTRLPRVLLQLRHDH